MERDEKVSIPALILFTWSHVYNNAYLHAYSVYRIVEQPTAEVCSITT